MKELSEGEYRYFKANVALGLIVFMVAFASSLLYIFDREKQNAKNYIHSQLDPAFKDLRASVSSVNQSLSDLPATKKDIDKILDTVKQTTDLSYDFTKEQKDKFDNKKTQDAIGLYFRAGKSYYQSQYNLEESTEHLKNVTLPLFDRTLIATNKGIDEIPDTIKTSKRAIAGLSEILNGNDLRTMVKNSATTATNLASTTTAIDRAFPQLIIQQQRVGDNLVTLSANASQLTGHLNGIAEFADNKLHQKQSKAARFGGFLLDSGIRFGLVYAGQRF